MPAIRDMVCKQCGTLKPDVWVDSLNTMKAILLCSACKKKTAHTAACNGGLRTRCRIFDWPTNPEYYRGQIEFGAPEAHLDTPDGPAVTSSVDGSVIHETKAAGFKERSAEREDKRYHNLRKTRGSDKLFFDQK
jgi:hypothetical protein